MAAIIKMNTAWNWYHCNRSKFYFLDGERTVGGNQEQVFKTKRELGIYLSMKVSLTDMTFWEFVQAYTRDMSRIF